MGFRTKAIQSGVYIDDTFQSVTTPIYPSSTFFFEALGKMPRFDYSRSGNPTRSALETNLASLEGGTRAIITSTGMAAVSTAMFMFKPGDHIVAGKDIYGGTYRVFTTLFAKIGLNFTFINPSNTDEIRASIRPETKAIWIETPSNPLLNLTDIAAVVEMARAKKIMTIADNTFLSPYFQRPLEMGVDLVVESMTKYINGHSDVLGGALITADEKISEQIAELSNSLGTVGSAFDSFLVLRGIKTLPARMEMHQDNALAVAQFLAQHPGVKRVYYPGLPGHPQHDLALRQMTGFGGMVSFEVDAAKMDVQTLPNKLKIFRLAESLGGVESLICQPWSMTHLSMPEEARSAAGITPQLFRLSVGLEDAEDLLEDLRSALEV